jgi:hypothetical protein
VKLYVEKQKRREVKPQDTLKNAIFVFLPKKKDFLLWRKKRCGDRGALKTAVRCFWVAMRPVVLNSDLFFIAFTCKRTKITKEQIFFLFDLPTRSAKARTSDSNKVQESSRKVRTRREQEKKKSICTYERSFGE